jgi:hypothetical protein
MKALLCPLPLSPAHLEDISDNLSIKFNILFPTQKKEKANPLPKTCITIVPFQVQHLALE